MSKRRNRRPPSQHKTAVLERDEPQESRVGRVPQIKAGGTNFGVILSEYGEAEV